MLEKGTLHFHDFVGISKTYPLQSLKIKKVFKDGSGYKIRGIPVCDTECHLLRRKFFVCDVNIQKKKQKKTLIHLK